MDQLAFRTNTEAATGAIAKLLPDMDVRRAVAELIAASIRFAHAQAPASWELTAWPDFIRLNVGQIAVLEVSSIEVILYTATGLPSENPRYKRIEPHGYRAVNVPTECWAISLDEISRLETGLWGRHRELPLSATRAKRMSPFRRAHSPGVVVAIAQLIGSMLPQPAYAHELEGGPAVVTPDSELSRGLFGSAESNRAAEESAVQLAIARLSADGWYVRSVERDRCDYDLHCLQLGTEVHVEVKEVQGKPNLFIIIAGEVRRAEADPCFALILVG